MIWKRRQTFSEWLADNPEPSLQELAERWGAYSKIPVEANPDSRTAWESAARRSRL
jgi:hypothetical protein